MTARRFVENCRAERDSLFARYADPTQKTGVLGTLDAAGLSGDQRRQVYVALDQALTDAFYTMLLGLGGAAALGADQQRYRIFDEQGQLVSESKEGDLETLAYEIFQNG